MNLRSSSVTFVTKLGYRTAMLGAIAVALLVLPACGGGKAAAVVHTDLSRIARAFPGPVWGTFPPPANPMCPETGGGVPEAGAAGLYADPARGDYRGIPYPFTAVGVVVDYRSAEDAKRDLEEFATEA